MKIFLDNRGQTVMEYVVISALIGILCVGAVVGYGRTQRTKYNNMRSVISNRVTIAPVNNGNGSDNDE